MQESGRDVESWRTSTTSGEHECVEVGFASDAVFVRNSKDREGPVLAFTGVEWAAFLAGVRNGEFDRK